MTCRRVLLYLLFVWRPILFNTVPLERFAHLGGSSDGWRLAKITRRVFPRRAKCIGAANAMLETIWD